MRQAQNNDRKTELERDSTAIIDNLIKWRKR